MRIEFSLAQTAKTDPALVFPNPFASMVPITRGLFIGGPLGPRLGAYFTFR